MLIPRMYLVKQGAEDGNLQVVLLLPSTPSTTYPHTLQVSELYIMIIPIFLMEKQRHSAVQ